MPKKDTRTGKAKKPGPKQAVKPKKEAKPEKKTPAQPRAPLPSEAVIINFRRGRHRQRTNQLLLEAEGIDSRAKAAQLIGKKVVWTSPAKKRIAGRITSPHGNSGVLRARFEKGLPGTALTKKVEIR